MDPRKPVIPLHVDSDDDHVVVHRDGTIRDAVNIVLSPEDVGRIRAGYVCAMCLETQDTPFPKECWVCKFPMADQQSEYVSKAYKGNTRMGPSSSLEDEFALMEELEFRQRRGAEVSVPQILVPKVW